MNTAHTHSQIEWESNHENVPSVKFIQQRNKITVTITFYIMWFINCYYLKDSIASFNS